MGYCLVEEGLDVGADVHAGELVVGRGGVGAVGEEDVDKVVVGVDPEHGAGETGVAEGVLRGLRTGLSVLGGVEELFIEAEGATVALLGEVACVEGVDGFLLEVALAVIDAAVEEHLHEFGHLAGGGEEACVAADAAEGIGIGVVYIAPYLTTEGIDLGGGNTQGAHTVVGGTEGGVAEAHGAVEVGADILIEGLTADALDHVGQKHEAEVAVAVALVGVELALSNYYIELYILEKLCVLHITQPISNYMKNYHPKFLILYLLSFLFH